MNILPTFDIDTIKQIIQNDFPGIAIKNINLIANGWDNMVAEINDEYIFRFPKYTDSTFYQEIKILDLLQEKTSVLTPKIEFLGRSYTYMGYKKIPGNVLTSEVYETLSPAKREKLIFDLANFLKEFHASISVAQAKEMGLEVEDYESYLDLIKKRLNNRFDDVQISSFIKSTCVEFASMANKQQNIVVLYNDLHTENIAFDNINKRVVGIFDFGDVTIGDIHFDFHQLYKFDPNLMSAVALKYRELTGVNLELRRMVVSARINELCDLAEFIDKPESRVYKNAMARIGKWIGDIDIFKNR